MIGYTFRTKNADIELELNIPSKSKHSNDVRAMYMIQFLKNGRTMDIEKTGLAWPRQVPGQFGKRCAWLESKEHVEAFAECLEASEKESYLKIVKDSFKPKIKK